MLKFHAFLTLKNHKTSYSNNRVQRAAQAPTSVPASNFDRYDYWVRVLEHIRLYFSDQLQRDHGAVCIKKQADDERSLGVNRILENYHILDSAAQARVLANPDQGKQRSLEAWRHVVDPHTVEVNRIETLSTNKYEHYEEAINAVTEFNKIGLMPIATPEFLLGSRNLIARETPISSTWVFVVGAIDMFLYNRRTGKLVIAEVKNSGPQSDAGGNVRFLSMEQLYMKEKNCMQVTMYGLLIICMASEANIPINPDDIELVLFANNRPKRTSIVWSLSYQPMTFLGKNWAPGRWHGLLDTGCFQILNNVPPASARRAAVMEPVESKCHLCGSTNHLGKTRSAPIEVICRACYSTRRCECGRLLRHVSRKYCGQDCPNLKTGVVHTRQPSIPPAPDNSVIKWKKY